MYNSATVPTLKSRENYSRKDYNELLITVFIPRLCLKVSPRYSTNVLENSNYYSGSFFIRVFFIIFSYEETTRFTYGCSHFPSPILSLYKKNV